MPKPRLNKAVTFEALRPDELAAGARHGAASGSSQSSAYGPGESASIVSAIVARADPVWVGGAPGVGGRRTGVGGRRPGVG